MWKQQQDWRPQRSGKSIHDIKQDNEPWPVEQDQHDRSFDSVKIKHLNFDKVKSIIFTKLESDTLSKRASITYKIDSGSDGNLMPFNRFKTVFHKSTLTGIACHKRTHRNKNSLILSNKEEMQ